MTLMLLFALLVSSPAGQTQKKTAPPINLPSTEAIPPDVTSSLNRQEDRLNRIEVKVAEIDTSLTDFKDDTQKGLGNINSKLDDMSATNTILRFIINIMTLLIPGLFIAWYADHLLKKRRKAKQVPSAKNET